MVQHIVVDNPALAYQERINELEDGMLFLQGEVHELQRQVELYDAIFRAIRDQLGLALADIPMQE